MPANYLVLGQVATSANTDTTLYTTPISTQAVVSTIFVCNRAGTAATFRIAIRPNGAALANQHYIAFDVPIDPNAVVPFTTGVTLGDTDVVTVRASSASLSFSAYGTEVTP